jgi:hypothetical protein
MPFVAECQFCHAKMRVPDDSAGRSISCPRCGDWFTLAPMEKQPEAPPPDLRPTAAASAAAAAVLAAVDADEEPEPEGSPAEGSQPRPRREPDPQPWRRPWAFPYELFGGTALALAGVGVAFASLPGWQSYGMVLGGLAVIFGVTGWVVAAKPDRGGRVRPAVGAVLGVAVVTLSLVWPGFLGGGPPFGDNTPRPFGRGAPTPGSENLAADPDSGGAARAASQLGTLEIRVVSAESVPVRFVGTAAAGAPERLLKVTVRVFNGSAERPVTYHHWSRPLPGEKTCLTVLRDESGKEYALSSFGAARTSAALEQAVTVPPLGKSEDVLTFEVPPKVKSNFELHVPLAAVGGTGMLRLVIPYTTVVAR